MVSQENFEIIQCASCGFKRTSPRPDQNHIGKYYDSPAYKSHNESSKGLFDVLYNFLRDRAARKKAKFLSQRSTLFHVLEHLPEPLETKKALYAKASPGACLILALPNPDSWDAHHYGTHWAAWDVPIHFWHFRKEDVKRLAKESGWNYESVDPMPLDAFYVGLLSESFRHGSKRWISATLKGLWSNFRGGKDNTSSLLYVLRKPS